MQCKFPQQRNEQGNPHAALTTKYGGEEYTSKRSVPFEYTHGEPNTLELTRQLQVLEDIIAAGMVAATFGEKKLACPAELEKFDTPAKIKQVFGMYDSEQRKSGENRLFTKENTWVNNQGEEKTSVIFKANIYPLYDDVDSGRLNNSRATVLVPVKVDESGDIISKGVPGFFYQGTVKQDDDIGPDYANAMRRGGGYHGVFVLQNLFFKLAKKGKSDRSELYAQPKLKVLCFPLSSEEDASGAKRLPDFLSQVPDMKPPPAKRSRVAQQDDDEEAEDPLLLEEQQQRDDDDEEDEEEDDDEFAAAPPSA